MKQSKFSRPAIFLASVLPILLIAGSALYFLMLKENKTSPLESIFNDDYKLILFSPFFNLYTNKTTDSDSIFWSCKDGEREPISNGGNKSIGALAWKSLAFASLHAKAASISNPSDALQAMRVELETKIEQSLSRALEIAMGPGVYADTAALGVATSHFLYVQNSIKANPVITKLAKQLIGLGAAHSLFLADDGLPRLYPITAELDKINMMMIPIAARNIFLAIKLDRLGDLEAMVRDFQERGSVSQRFSYLFNFSMNAVRSSTVPRETRQQELFDQAYTYLNHTIEKDAGLIEYADLSPMLKRRSCWYGLALQEARELSQDSEKISSSLDEVAAAALSEPTYQAVMENRIEFGDIAPCFELLVRECLRKQDSQCPNLRALNERFIFPYTRQNSPSNNFSCGLESPQKMGLSWISQVAHAQILSESIKQ